MNTGQRIFVVDDEPVIAETLYIILSQAGFEVYCFTEPTGALQAAEVRHPHLLISDVMMPGMCGVDLAMAIRDLCPNCKILLFSGQASTCDLLSESRRKGYDFTLLQKPVHPTDLLTAIQIAGC